MVRELAPVDIGAVSRVELERLVDEVQQTGRSRIVRRGDRDVALLSPLPAVRAPKRRSELRTPRVIPSGISSGSAPASRRPT